MTNTNPTVRCTILFTSGALDGITYDNHPLRADFASVGRVVRKPCAGGSSYKIIAVHG